MIIPMFVEFFLMKSVLCIKYLLTDRYTSKTVE